MPSDEQAHNSSATEQLKKYAQDLVEVYNQEKEKRKELENMNLQLKEYAGALNTTINQLKEANAELKDAYLDTIYRLSLAAEYKDEETGSHIARTSRYCSLIAKKIGLSHEEVDIIFWASPMHDIGKVGIPDAILLKPGKLTTAEFEIIKTHTIIGGKILSNSKAKMIQVAEQIALTHHERWNGSGYPYGLAGEEIPLVGRIVCLIDVFDALTTRRPYKNAYPVEVALEIMRKERERHFDPAVLDIFLENIEAILQIREEVGFSDYSTSVDEFQWSERDASYVR